MILKYLNLVLVAKVFAMVYVPVVAVEDEVTERSVQLKLSPDPCNLKVLEAPFEIAQLTKSKLIPVIAM